MALIIRTFVVFDNAGAVVDPELNCGLYLRNSIPEPWIGYGALYDKTGYGPDTINTGVMYDTEGDPVADPSAITFPITALDDGLLGSFWMPGSLVGAGAIAVIGTSPGNAATWAETGAMVENRQYGTLTVLSDGTVLATGGETTDNPSASAEIYDPILDTWAGADDMAVARKCHTATLLADGTVLVAGGEAGGASLDSCEIFDPATGHWTTVEPLLAVRKQHTATLLPSGLVLVVGGWGTVGSYKTAELYDPSADTWTATGTTLTNERIFHTATPLGGGVMVVGGKTHWDSHPTETIEFYDPIANTWALKADLDDARYNHAACVLDSGYLLVSGGAGYAGPISTCRLYDFVGNSWANTGPLNDIREGHASILLPDFTVLVTGGTQGGFLTDAELYDPDLGTWAYTVSSTSYAHLNLAALTTSGVLNVVLVVGGSDMDGDPVGAELYTMGAPRHEPAWIVRPIFLDDNTNQFWAWRLVDVSTKARWVGGDGMPTIENYCEITTGALVVPPGAPPVVYIGNGLFIATPSASDIALGVQGWLSCPAGAAVSGDLGATDGRLTGQAFASLPLLTATPAVLGYGVVSSNFLLYVSFATDILAVGTTDPTNFHVLGLSIIAAAQTASDTVRLSLANEPRDSASYNLWITIGTIQSTNGISVNDEALAPFVGVSTLPTVVSVLFQSATSVRVIYSKPMRQVSALNSNDALYPGNYAFTGLTVSLVSPISTTEIEVTTSLQVDIPYAWTIGGPCDLAGNPIAASGIMAGYDGPVVAVTGVFIFLDPHTVQITFVAPVKVNAILFRPDVYAFLPRFASVKQLYVESVVPVTTPLTTIILLTLRDEASVSGAYNLRITGLIDSADLVVEVTL